MHLLPLTIAKVATAADSKNSTRFALSGVHIVLDPGGKFLVETTDSKRLLRVSGECEHKPDEYLHADLHARKEDKKRREFLCPADTWRKAFTMLNPKAKWKPILNSVGLVLEKDSATFGMTDLESTPTLNTREVEGKYPPTNDIMRQTTKGEKFAFAADPKLLAEGLLAMASMMDKTSMRVEFFTNGQDKPFMVRATGENGVLIEFLVMPLYGKAETKPSQALKQDAPRTEAPPAEPLPKLDEDQRREPDLDPHACVKCKELDCTCSAMEETDLEGDAPSPPLAVPIFVEQPVQSYTMAVAD